MAPARLPARPPGKRVEKSGSAAARDDGGNGAGARAFFPIPDDESSLPQELSEAEKYLLEVRKQHAALPAFTKVLNPYSRSAPPDVPASALDALSAEVVETVSHSAAAGRHPFVPTDIWRETFLNHFLDLRANLAHTSTQPAASDPAQAVPARYLPVPKNGDGRAWKEYMMGAKRRKLRSQPSSATDSAAPGGTLLPTAPESVADQLEPIASQRSDPSAQAADEDDEEAAMNDVSADPTYLDDEEEAMNDGGGVLGGYEFESSDDEQDVAMTAEEVFNAFEFGDWYEPVEEETGDPEEEYMDEGDKEDGVEGELEPELEKHKPREPSMALVQGLSDKTCIAVLKHITFLVNSPAVPCLPPLLARWAFALLAHLDPTTGLLASEHVSHLRSLARACVAVLGAHRDALAAAATADERAAWLVGAKAEERMGCWMVFTAVVGVWAQRDLEDELLAVFPRPGGS